MRIQTSLEAAYAFVILVAHAALATADSSNATYRWVYRNPLSILAADEGNTDEGMGSYYGTRNSINNYPPNGSQLALAYSHGATLAVLPNGSLATIWQASTEWWEGSRGQSAFWSLSDDYGDTWGPPVELFRNASGGGGGPIWGPQIHVSGSKLFMFLSSTAPAACEASAGSGGGTAWPPGGSLLVVTSTDNGESWGAPRTIFSADEEGGIAKLNVARVAVTASGAWLLPFWREASGPDFGKCWGPAGLSYHGVPGVFRSTDEGETWRQQTHEIRPAAGTPRSKWLIENAIAPFEDAAHNRSGLLQVFRDDTGTTWQSISSDDGLTWSDAAPGQLPSPDSKADLWPLPDGRIVAAFNNVTNQRRQNLSLAVTVDGGSTWQHMALIEGNTSNAPHTGAFSYPSVLYLEEANRIMVVYSVGYPPSNETALLAGAPKTAPGVYVPRLPLPHANPRPVPQLPRRGETVIARRLSPAQGPAISLNGSLASHGLRRRLSSATDSQFDEAVHTGASARGLKQVPFEFGAWNFISYGIRMAYLDADTELQAAVPAAPRAQRVRPVTSALITG